MEDIKLIHGDCLEEMAKIPDKSIDLIVTDPPYELSLHGGAGCFKDRKLINDKHLDFISKGFDYDQCFNEFIRICKIPNMLIFCSNNQVSKIMSFFEGKNPSATLLVWQKTNPVPLCCGKHLSDVEFIVYVRGKGATFNNDTPFEYKKKVYTSGIVPSKSRLHPTQKSVTHIEQYLKLHSKENDVVLDPFMGSGTTGIACVNTNRRFIGIELDENYFNIAKKRIDDAVADSKGRLL